MIKQLTLDFATVEDIMQVHEFVDAICLASNVDEDTCFALKLSVEEAYNNIVMHGYAGHPGPVTLEGYMQEDMLVVRLKDHAPRFSPDQAPAPDLDAGLLERRVGGLGWYLIHKMMDQVHHEYVAGGNVLTLGKKISPSFEKPH
jgi:anti-sigma regulatory factor (Ser/Thr protein kinase)